MKKIRILIVEDNEFDYQLIINRLNKSDICFEHNFTQNLDEFSDLLKSFCPDIVLSDFNLGAFSGLDVIDTTKSYAPFVPVIIITGRVNEETSVQCIKQGAWHYILKDNLMMIPTVINNALEYVEEQKQKLNAFETLKLQNEKLKALNEELIAAKEKAEENSRLKSQFIKNISHEIRTPLNGILGFTSLLSCEKEFSDEYQMYFDLIQTNGVDLLNIMTNIFNLSIIESNQIESKKSQIDLSNLLSRIKQEFESQVITKSLSIDIALNNANEQTIIIEEQLLYEALKQITDNAVKFTEKGKIEISSSIENQNLSIKIKDSGPGISSSKHEEIFNNFIKYNDDSSQVHRGNGIGLSIVKGFVKHMNGTISVDSELGKGSVFTLTFPIDNN